MEQTRTLTAALPDRFAVPKVRLRVTRGPQSGTECILDRRLIYVGSAPDNDLVLDDASVSRTHVRIEGERGGHRVRDLGSKNGTWLGGTRIVEAFLAGPTALRVGATELAFEPLDETHEVALSREPKFGDLLGESAEMREIFALLARVAPTTATVLVEGESGTGKELVADAVHRHSPRADGPFVVFDCSAVQPELMESELFGHVRGAFTGAVATRAGAMAEADGGTLFLDEIGELSLELQPKLLRALERREYKPVGSNERRRVDVRIVAATNRDLREMVDASSFREDLYYRLAVIRVRLPSLRRRPDDIPLLVRHFLAEAAGTRGLTVSFDTMERLKRHSWPGNVRELRNYIERAAVLSDGRQIDLELTAPRRRVDPLPADALAVDYALPFKDAKARLLDTFERRYWERALTEHDWNVSAAARATGLHRKSLEYLLRKLELRRPERDAS